MERWTVSLWLIKIIYPWDISWTKLCYFAVNRIYVLNANYSANSLCKTEVFVIKHDLVALVKFNINSHLTNKRYFSNLQASIEKVNKYNDLSIDHN